MFNCTKKVAQKYGSKIAATASGLLVSASAFATEVDPVVSAFTDLTTKVQAYAVPLMSFAVVGTGIAIAIKYIRKGRGAA